jgi:phytoene dehydrogenase-like protein
MDAHVVGSGPNGLAAAITLARAGWKVRVLEEQPTIGGGARSAELTLPGFVHDRCSAIHPLAIGSPFFRRLPLERHGLEWIQPEIALAHPLDDGTAAALHGSLGETCAHLGADAPAWRRLMEPLVENWDALSAEFLQPLLHFPRHPLLLARFGLLAVQSAVRLAARFRTDGARAVLAGLAAHSFLPLEAPVSGAFALVLGAAGHAVGWPLPRGGAQKISDALAAHLQELGGEIEAGRRVRDLRELPQNTTTLLDLTAWRAAEVAGDRLPARYREKLANFPHGPAIFKIDYALDAPIPWKADACRRAGTVHLGGTLEEIAASERDVACGRVPTRPFVLLAQQSISDPTRAPAGKHTAWAYCHVPYGCGADMTTAIEAQIERFAPGFGECILARHASGAGILQAENGNLVGGDISGGASDFWHLLARPTLSFTPYRTALRGLYLCSSSTPPGGGVHGMCGHYAARAVLADTR